MEQLVFFDDSGIYLIYKKYKLVILKIFDKTQKKPLTIGQGLF
jgi:hypothetical protein